MTNQEMKMQEVLCEAYNTYDKPLTRYATLKIGNPSLAEDLVQETFLKAWKYISKGGQIDAMKSFLYHVLNHLIIDEYRKRKAVSLDNLVEKGYEPSAVNESERAMDIIDGGAVVHLIDQLPPRYRTVIADRYVQDLSIEEIAEVTHQSRNTVAVQIHRGLSKLKTLAEQTHSFSQLQHAA
jgi:RNA polymerase sigma factor (sigma-70 family)